MGELEDQIARLAHARADEVPPYRAPASLDRARASRRGAWVAVAAAITAIAVAVGALLWSRGDDSSVRTGPTPATEVPAPTTIPPTTPSTPPTIAPAAGACPTEHVDTNPMSGGPSGRTEDAVLVNVQIQTSACVDQVAFSFRGAPDWTVEYQSAPIMLQPQGEPVAVEGEAFLVVRFDHSDAGRAGYTGPRQFRAGPLSHVTEVRMTQDFEAVLTWVIGLDARVPFGVEQRDGQVVIRFPESGSARVTRCDLPDLHVSVSVPDGWFAELSDDYRCRSFGPQPFTIVPQSDAPVPVRIHAAATSTIETLANPTTSPVASAVKGVITVDGRTGSCLAGTWNGHGLEPAGTPFFICEVPWDAAGFLGISADGLARGDFASFRAGVIELMQSALYIP